MIPHGLAQLFLDDILFQEPSNEDKDYSKTKPDFHVSTSFPVCSKACLDVSIKAFQEISGSSIERIEVEGTEAEEVEEEEKKEEENT